MKLAGELVIGDMLLAQTGSRLVESAVWKLREGTAPGIYAPLTASARVIVDGVLCSSYAMTPTSGNLNRLVEIVDTEIGERILHAGVAPMRYFFFFELDRLPWPTSFLSMFSPSRDGASPLSPASLLTIAPLDAAVGALLYLQSYLSGATKLIFS
jgi:hypothetical protein